MSATKPARLGPRGSALWDELIDGRSPDASQVMLIGEACRVADRLERLDAVLLGKGRVWIEIATDVRDDDKVAVVVDSVLGEARQQQTVLRQLLVTLGAGKLAASRKGRSALDEVAARRTARRSAAAAGE